MAEFRGRFNGLLVQEPLSKEAKYWLGFLFADGCISYAGNYPRISVGIGSVDSQHMIDFANFCGVESHAFNSPSTFGHYTGRQVRFAVTKEHAAKFASYGIVQRKSLREVPPAIFLNDVDWWRGVIDGDGSLAKYGRRGINLQLCGSFATVQAFVQFVESVTGHLPGITKSDNGLCSAAAGGVRHSQMVLEKIYYKSCTPVLVRKLILAKSALDWKSLDSHGENNSVARLTNAQAAAIRLDRHSCWMIAQKYNVSTSTIKNVKAGRTYTDTPKGNECQQIDQ